MTTHPLTIDPRHRVIKRLHSTCFFLYISTQPPQTHEKPKPTLHIDLGEMSTEEDNKKGEYGQPDKGEYGLPDKGEYGLPDKGEYGLPAKGEYGIPDKGEYDLPDKSLLSNREGSFRMVLVHFGSVQSLDNAPPYKTVWI